MPRLPRSAVSLLREINQVLPEASATGTSDPDGFNVIREVTYDGPGIESILEAVATDHRLSSVKGAVVTFRSDPRSDNTQPFGVRAAAKVLKTEDPEPTLEERLKGMKVSEIREEFGFDEGVSKKDMIAEVLSDES